MLVSIRLADTVSLDLTDVNLRIRQRYVSSSSWAGETFGKEKDVVSTPSGRFEFSDGTTASGFADSLVGLHQDENSLVISIRSSVSVGPYLSPAPAINSAIMLDLSTNSISITGNNFPQYDVIFDGELVGTRPAESAINLVDFFS